MGLIFGMFRVTDILYSDGRGIQQTYRICSGYGERA